MKTTRREAILSGFALAASAALPAGATQQQNPKKKAVDTAFADAVALSDFEAAAKHRISHMAWEYIAGAAGDEITLRWNRDAFDRIRLNPRVLRDVSPVDTTVKVLGETWPLPVMLARLGISVPRGSSALAPPSRPMTIMRPPMASALTFSFK